MSGLINQLIDPLTNWLNN